MNGICTRQGVYYAVGSINVANKIRKEKKKNRFLIFWTDVLKSANTPNKTKIEDTPFSLKREQCSSTLLSDHFTDFCLFRRQDKSIGRMYYIQRVEIRSTSLHAYHANRNACSAWQLDPVVIRIRNRGSYQQYDFVLFDVSLLRRWSDCCSFGGCPFLFHAGRQIELFCL